jgi:hypothetical protein
MISRELASQPARPTTCPECSGRDLTTASKVIDKSTYWRCLTCGEIWRPGLRDRGSRFGFPR